MNNQATKTPWEAIKTNTGTIISTLACDGVSDICYMNMCLEGDANARLIVKSVNCHDVLVEALKNSLIEMEISLGHCEEEERSQIGYRINMAKEALAKAGVK